MGIKMPERLYAVKTFALNSSDDVEFIADEEQLVGDTEYIRADVVQRMIDTAQQSVAADLKQPR